MPSAGIRLALAARHPLAGCERVDWALLKDEHFLLGRQATALGLDDHVARSLSRLGSRPSLAILEVSLELVIKLVAMGLGVSLVDETSSAISYPGVAFRRLGGEEYCVPICAVWLAGNDNPALRRFLSLMRTRAARAQKSSAAKLGS